MKICSVICSLTLLVCSNAFAADLTKISCMGKAREEIKTCKTACDATLRDAKSQCGLNPACREVCQSELESCRAPYDSGLKSCKERCIAALDSGKEQCKVQVGCAAKGGKCETNTAYLACRKPIAVEAFSCKQTCEDTQKVDPAYLAGIKVCKESQRSCLKLCTPTKGL